MLFDSEPDAVVVVAGLPGAGKTTLVAGEPRALDSDRVREAMAKRRFSGAFLAPVDR